MLLYTLLLTPSSHSLDLTYLDLVNFYYSVVFHIVLLYCIAM